MPTQRYGWRRPMGLLMLIALLVASFSWQPAPVVAQSLELPLSSHSGNETRPTVGSTAVLWIEDSVRIREYDTLIGQVVGEPVVTAQADRFIVDMAVDGTRVVWAEEEMSYPRVTHIMTKILGQPEIRVGRSAWKLLSVDVSGDQIVWETNSGTKSLIYGSQAVEEAAPQQIKEYDCVASQCPQAQPRISGAHVVYRDGTGRIIWLNRETGSETVVSETHLCNGVPFQNGPADIDGNLIVWESYQSCTSGDVLGFDVSTQATTIIAEGNAHQYLPRVSGVRVVWFEQGSRVDLFTKQWGESTATRINSDAAVVYADGSNHNIGVSDRYVVWADQRGGNADVYSYSLAVTPPTGTEIDYFALGDSVASGHGLMDDTEDGQPANGCRQSDKAYPNLVRDYLLTKYEKVNFYFLACSGTSTERPTNAPDRRKWFRYQVNSVLAQLKDPSRPADREAIVTITIGINDLSWTEPGNLLDKLFATNDKAFERWLTKSTNTVSRRIDVEIERLLRVPNTKVVFTNYYNPFNKRSPLYAYGFAEQPHERTLHATNTINVAYGRVAAKYALSGRVRLVNLQTRFIGHESAPLLCGLSPIGSTTWIQAADDPLSNSNPKIRDVQLPWSGDCFHPNVLGAKAISEALVEEILTLVE